MGFPSTTYTPRGRIYSIGPFLVTDKSRWFPRRDWVVPGGLLHGLTEVLVFIKNKMAVNALDSIAPKWSPSSIPSFSMEELTEIRWLKGSWRSTKNKLD